MSGPLDNPRTFYRIASTYVLAGLDLSPDLDQSRLSLWITYIQPRPFGAWTFSG